MNRGARCAECCRLRPSPDPDCDVVKYLGFVFFFSVDRALSGSGCWCSVERLV